MAALQLPVSLSSHRRPDLVGPWSAQLPAGPSLDWAGLAPQPLGLGGWWTSGEGRKSWAHLEIEGDGKEGAEGEGVKG